MPISQLLLDKADQAEGMNEMVKRRVGLLAATAGLALGATVGLVQPAYASTSDCYSGQVCLWNNGTWQSIPFISVSGGTHPVWANVTDNITSSGISKRSGSYTWYGLNQLNPVTSEFVATFPYNTAVSLLQTYGDNKIDDLYL